MRTDYFLGQNRGDDYRSSIKSYSLQAWRDAGGEDGNEPYFEEAVQRRGLDYCPVIRVYVDARIFSAWEAWKADAEEEAARRNRHGVAANALSDSQRTTRHCSLQSQRSELEKQLERWGIR